MRDSADVWGQAGTSDEFATMACVNFGNSWSGYVGGFRMAAAALLEQLEANGRDQDFLVYPIVFNYRHAVELSMKRVIEQGRRLFDEQGDFPDGHSLAKLWTTCRPVVVRVFNGDPDVKAMLPSVDAVIAALDDVDPGGTAFRYPVGIKRGGVRPPSLPSTMTNLPLRAFSDEVEQVLDLLDALNNQIAVELDFKDEASEEYRAALACWQPDLSDL